jgi:hypothetical protein
MPEPTLAADVLADLLNDLRAVGPLAKNEKSFAATFEAYRAADAKTYQAVLRRLKLYPRCRYVCDWICSKECVLLCFELCGPPPLDQKLPDPRQFAAVIAKLTSDEKIVQRLATTIEKRDAAGYRRLIKELRLEPYCHLICRWVCAVRCRLVCRLFCEPPIVTRPDLAVELRVAGSTIRRLLEKRELLDGAVAGFEAGDAEQVHAALRPLGLLDHCYVICEWYASWHCMRVCLPLCRAFPVEKIAEPLQEALEFARAQQVLLKRPGLLAELADGVMAGNADRFAAILKELKLERYCIQICHWICLRHWRRFCRLVCPPIYDHPWFTHVGDFGIVADIDPGTGLTNKAQAGHGGPGFAFFGCLSLRGYCPKRDPAHPAEAMKYRFVYVKGGATTPITDPFVCEVLVGSRYVTWDADGTGLKPTLQSVRVRGTGPSPDPPPFPGGPAPWGAPPDHYVVPDAQGWITVDPQALNGGYNGWLMGFASHVAVPGGDPAPGVAAGTAVPGPAQKGGTDLSIVFEATRVGNPTAAPPDYTNTLGRIRVNNWASVTLLDLLQFHSGGGTPCSPLSTDLDIEYTTDHEQMAAWSLEMITAASVVPAPTFPSGIGPRGAAGSDHHDITSWPTCSYAIRLHTRRSLTTGLVDDSGTFAEKTFCIGARRRPIP